MKLEQYAKMHKQRSGQFLSSAIGDYLIENNREYTDQEITSCLFYMEDESLNQILETYSNVVIARKGFGFEKKGSGQ